MLNLVLLFSLLLSGAAEGAVNKAVYRIKGVTYFQSDIDSLVQTFIQTKRCLGRKMLVESYTGRSRYSTLKAKKNIQSLPLAKVIHYAAFSSSVERDLLLKRSYNRCLNNENYKLLSTELFLKKNKNFALIKGEINRSFGHILFNRKKSPKLWQDK